jgi:Ca-activated chloride channel family protein
VWSLLLIAAARPQWTGEPITLPTTGRDLMLAVDISGSMATEDMEVGDEFVDRLNVVKAVVSQFVSQRSGDRVGLVLFGTNAYLQAPLTFDLASVNRLLIEAPVGIAGGKTAIGDAIGLAVKRLRLRPHEDKVIVLLTDGANNVGEVQPEKAAELAAYDKIKIYTIGVGADEMRMPGLFGALTGRITNPSADLDEDTLTAIAETTNGRYFRARDTQSLQEIYALIDQLEPIDQDPETYRPVQALYYYPFAGALIGFALFLLLDLRTRRVA